MQNVKMPSGVFPPRVALSAVKLLNRVGDVIESAAKGVGSYDVCIAAKPYEGVVVGVALTTVLAEMNSCEVVAHFSATKFFDLKKNFEETTAGGFDSFNDVLHADLMLVSELSYVAASVASEIDAMIYRRFCIGKQTIISGYNMPVESGFTAETIDGYGGYPLLAHRLNSTVVVFAPELSDEHFK